MLEYLKSCHDRMRSNREINSLDESVLKDLGISRFGLRRLSSAPQLVMRRLTAMSARQNVDLPALSSDLQNMSEIVDRCGNCSATRACAKFLGNPDTGADQATFCPNLAELRRLSHTS